MRTKQLTNALTCLCCAPLLLLGCSATAEPLGELPKPADRFEEVAFNLIETVNSLDSVGYRRYFSPRLLVKYPLAEIGESLRDTKKQFGKIESFRIIRSSDGNRGVLVLNMEKNVFDAHLRLDKNGKLARDQWYPRFVEPGAAPEFSGADERRIKARFKPVVTKFFDAFGNEDPQAIYALLKEEDDGSKSASLEDISAIITRFNSRGGIKRLGEYQIESENEVTVPIDQGESKYGYEFEYSFTFALNDQDKISKMSIANYAERESVGKSLADLGADTSMTSDLFDFVDLQERFDQDSGKVRFIALLSPT